MVIHGHAVLLIVSVLLPLSISASYHCGRIYVIGRNIGSPRVQSLFSMASSTLMGLAALLSMTTQGILAKTVGAAPLFGAKLPTAVPSTSRSSSMPECLGHLRQRGRA
jgi:hypothetical protein